MPLVVVCGQPCSGKSTVAARLAGLMQEQGAETLLIDEPSMHLTRDASYQSERSPPHLGGRDSGHAGWPEAAAAAAPAAAPTAGMASSGVVRCPARFRAHLLAMAHSVHVLQRSALRAERAEPAERTDAMEVDDSPEAVTRKRGRRAEAGSACVMVIRCCGPSVAGGASAPQAARRRRARAASSSPRQSGGYPSGRSRS